MDLHSSENLIPSLAGFNGGVLHYLCHGGYIFTISWLEWSQDYTTTACLIWTKLGGRFGNRPSKKPVKIRRESRKGARQRLFISWGCWALAEVESALHHYFIVLAWYKDMQRITLTLCLWSDDTLSVSSVVIICRQWTQIISRTKHAAPLTTSTLCCGSVRLPSGLATQRSTFSKARPQILPSGSHPSQMFCQNGVRMSEPTRARPCLKADHDLNWYLFSFIILDISDLTHQVLGLKISSISLVFLT